MVSDSHANFVLNINRASGSDLVNVIEHMQKVVFSTSGVNLEKEVVIIGKLNE
jgi:UDP-N-acetylmuramate dehydrogenase